MRKIAFGVVVFSIFLIVMGIQDRDREVGKMDIRATVLEVGDLSLFIHDERGMEMVLQVPNGDDVSKYKPGMKIGVWLDGPVRESYPIQGTALHIEIIEKEKEGTLSTSEEELVIMKGSDIYNLKRLDDFIKGVGNVVKVVQYSIEGDPIFTTLSHKNGVIQMEYDTRKDKYGSQTVKRYTCEKVERMESETEVNYIAINCKGNEQKGDIPLFIIENKK